ncbi:hypothetical protein D1007_10247 [Hordeum vulgare]|nr:hypothetical protein D1007_10247 [Hordeum vulgare]
MFPSCPTTPYAMTETMPSSEFPHDPLQFRVRRYVPLSSSVYRAPWMAPSSADSLHRNRSLAIAREEQDESDRWNPPVGERVVAPGSASLRVHLPQR